VFIAAALCPWTPLIVGELTGGEAVVPELRRACAEATARLVQAQPELVVVVGPGAETQQWDPRSRLDLSVFAPVLGRTGDPALPPAIGLGAFLLDQAGYQGRRMLQEVAEREGTASCAELGAAIGKDGVRVGLLAMGDGTARRSQRAPGHFDERAAEFDARAEQALRRDDLDALLAISPTLASELMATGRPAWQVLAGAMQPTTPATEVLYADAPFGVAYIVAFMTRTRPHIG
jgi:hypothetical protein